MEELFQLIFALFIISFPLLSALSRRRRARRVRKQREQAAGAGEAPGASQQSGRRRRGGRGSAARTARRAGPDRERGRVAADRPPADGGPRSRFDQWVTQFQRMATGASAPEASGSREAEPGGQQAPAAERAAESRVRREPRQPDRSATMQQGSGDRAADGQRIGSPQAREAADRIAQLPQLQQAVVWSEILGRPRALRDEPQSWD